jgi:hypothetical protein
MVERNAEDYSVWHVSVAQVPLTRGEPIEIGCISLESGSNATSASLGCGRRPGRIDPEVEILVPERALHQGLGAPWFHWPLLAGVCRASPVSGKAPLGRRFVRRCDDPCLGLYRGRFPGGRLTIPLDRHQLCSGGRGRQIGRLGGFDLRLGDLLQRRFDPNLVGDRSPV